MPKFSLFILLILSAGSYCHAQVDTEFWFAPPDVTSGHGDSPISIKISTLDKAANVLVLQPARSNLQIASVSIPPNTTYTVLLSHLIGSIETDMPATVMKTGLKIVSSAPITAYYEVGAPWNAEIFALKGKNALGNKFVIPGQNFYNNSGTYFPTPYSSFDVVATANNTVVTVRPTRPVFGHLKDSVITVKLNAGETYSFRKPTLLAMDNPVGTIVESSKPIAVTIKDDSVIAGNCRDVIGDQIVPVKVAGSEYVVLRGFLNMDEYLFITATEDNTQVFIGGSTMPIAVLKAGQLYRHQITVLSTYILANKTIYVFHVTGFGCELGMALLPSINCKGSQQIGFTRSTSEFFGLNILVRKEGIGNFKLNNSAALIHSSAFSAVPGTDGKWYTAQLSFNSSAIPVGQASQISNDQHSFQVGIINGNAMTTCRYGYFSAFSTLFLGDDFKFCEGETATIDAGAGKESYLWSTGETTQQINVSNSGSYWVKAVKEECTLYDTININIIKGVEDLGPDIKICKGDIAKIDGKPNFSWKWSDNSSEQHFSTKTPGKYWVSVFDYTGCQASDTIDVSWYVRSPENFDKVDLNVASIDTLEEKDVNISWTVTAPQGIRDNSLVLFKRMAGTETWEQFLSFSAAIDSVVDKDNATDNEIIEYYISLVDFCTEELVRSDIHNTIQLTGEVDTLTDVINLNWNHYQGWKMGVQRYELWRKLDDLPGYQLMEVLPGSENSFSSTIAADGFNHRYSIRAIENSGHAESWSNNIEFEFDHPIYIPNVFTPDGDNYNQYFEIKKIELYKNSELRVLNRWGKEVFESHNYKNEWDGNDLDGGVYYYILNLKRNNKIFKGTISILK